MTDLFSTQLDLLSWSCPRPDGMALPADVKMGPNCGVTAIAIVAGVSFNKAFAFIRDASGRAANWKGTTCIGDRRKAFHHFGIKVAEIDVPTRREGRMTLRTWIDHRARKGVTYMIDTTRHVQVVRDGVVTDQRGKKPIADYWGKNKIVTRVFVIKD